MTQTELEDMKINYNIQCPNCGHGTIYLGKDGHQCAKCKHILKPFNPWTDKVEYIELELIEKEKEEIITITPWPKSLDKGNVIRSGDVDEELLADTYEEQLKKENEMMIKQQASVDRFKSIFAPKKPAPKQTYRYTIRYERHSSYSSYTMMERVKKLSRLELWLIRRILGWRLELQ